MDIPLDISLNISDNIILKIWYSTLLQFYLVSRSVDFTIISACMQMEIMQKNRE